MIPSAPTEAGVEMRVATPDVDFAVTAFGDPSGVAVVLLHGWPDDRIAWFPIAKRLGGMGFYVVVPSLPGSGSSRVMRGSPEAAGQLPALVSGVTALLDAVFGRDRPIHLVGHDWGARTAYGVSLVRPARVRSVVALSAAWSPDAVGEPELPDPDQLKRYWYQWLLNTAMGEQFLRRRRGEFLSMLWTDWSPEWNSTSAELDPVVEAVADEQWVAVTLGYYRHRWWWGDSDDRYAETRKVLSVATSLTVPTLVIHGDADGCVSSAASDEMAQYVEAPYQRLVLPNVGHFPHRESENSVFDAVYRWITGVAANG